MVSLWSKTDYMSLYPCVSVMWKVNVTYLLTYLVPHTWKQKGIMEQLKQKTAELYRIRVLLTITDADRTQCDVISVTWRHTSEEIYPIKRLRLTAPKYYHSHVNTASQISGDHTSSSSTDVTLDDNTLYYAPPWRGGALWNYDRCLSICLSRAST